MQNLFKTFLCLIIMSSSALAGSFYVSPTGNDASDGLIPATAWATIDNGDNKGLVNAGDTINVYPGTYTISGSIQLDIDGSGPSPIVYRGIGSSPVIIDGNNLSAIPVILAGSYTVFQNFTVFNSREHLIRLNSDDCKVLNCIFYDGDKDGIRIESDRNLIYRNTIFDINENGIHNRDAGTDNEIFNNTIHNCVRDGIEVQAGVSAVRIINNIITSIRKGVDGASAHICAFNNIWNNSEAAYEGTSDSAGGLLADPQYTNSVSGDFTLIIGSPCINTGLDVGLDYLETEPDMGSKESGEVLPRSYYVASDGDNGDDGLTPGTAWLSMDRGEELGILIPGDTININAGTYNATRFLNLVSDGTAALPIMYRNSGHGKVIFDGTSVSSDVNIFISGDNTIIDGLEIQNCVWDGIWLESDSCQITNCYLHNINGDGIDIGGALKWGDNNLVSFNTITSCGEEGIEADVNSQYNKFYNNTIYSNNLGIQISHATGDSRVINNCITDNTYGISARAGNILAHNNVWNNSGGDYSVSAVDSAGSFSADPEFIDAPNGNFVPKTTSPLLDTGMDLGYAYTNLAPDVGAIEKYNVYYVDSAGDDSNDGLTAGTAWATIDNGDSILIPGDTVHVAAGTYLNYPVITSSGAQGDEIVYRGVPDSTIINSTGVIDGASLNGNYIRFVGFEIYGATNTNLNIAGSNITVDSCHLHSSKYCILIESGFNNTIRSSIIADNSSSGIESNSDSVYVQNCTFYKSGPTAIDFFKAEDNQIVNSIFYSDDVANVCIRATVTTTITYSDIFGFNTPLQGGIVGGTSYLEVDPLLVDPAAGNYHLASNSPLIDQGTDIGIPFNGLAPDMGALETSSLSSITIVYATDSLDADSTHTFTIQALDAEGFPADPGTLTWEHTFATGAIDADGLFTPSLVGTGTIIVTSSLGGVTDTTEVLTVIPGALVSMAVSPQRDTLTADETLQFLLSGLDANGNTISSISDITWSVTGGIGTIDNSGLFSPTKIGTGFINAEHISEIQAETDTILVIPGAVSYLETIPNSNSIEEGTTYQFTSYGYDSDSNLVGDFSATAVWSTTDPTGNVNATGLYTAGSNLSPPDYFVKAVYGGVFSDSSTVTVISNGTLSYVRIEYLDGTPASDTTLSTDNDSTVLYCRGYNSGDVLLGDVSVDWSIIGAGSIGTVTSTEDASTILILTTTGTGRVVADHSSGNADTTGIITCQVGVPALITISPDTATISADSNLQFSITLHDADGNVSDSSLSVTWEVIGGIGTISASGNFNASTAGIGKIAVSGAGLVDTTNEITVTPGTLNQIVITPNTATVGVGDSITFTASGRDSDNNSTGYGTLSWQVLGRVGAITSGGLFVADGPGVCSVMVTSQPSGLIAISSTITIEALYAVSLPRTSGIIKPGVSLATIQAVHIDNYYSVDKSLSSIEFHDISNGIGNTTELLSNIDNINLYLDTNDDSLLTLSDSLVCTLSAYEEHNTFTIDPALSITSGDGVTLFIGFDISNTAHDGDTLDVFMFSSTDILTTDGSNIDGEDSLNSYGHLIIDGLSASQLQFGTSGLTSISPGDTLYNILTVDIPRNGYRADTMTSFSVINTGTATEQDVDSLLLYQDNGNNQWDGPGIETRVGKLIYTGSIWIRSGISVPLENITNRFFVAACLSPYPEDGATLALTIPENGLEMVSDNDGPNDMTPSAPDTIAIETNEVLAVQYQALDMTYIVPGQKSTSLTAFEFINGYSSGVLIDSLRVNVSLASTDGATGVELLSQFDSLYIYQDLDGDVTTIDVTDTLLASCELNSSSSVLNTVGLQVAGGGGSVHLLCAVKTNLQNARNGNTINIGLNQIADVYTSASTLLGDEPVYNNVAHVVNAFPLSSTVVNEITGTNLFGGQENQFVLDFELPRDGYAVASLRGISLVNLGTISDFSALQTVKLWSDQGVGGPSGDDILLGELVYSNGVWALSSLNYQLSQQSNRLLVSVSISNDQFTGGSLQFAVPQNGVLYWSGTNGPDDGQIVNTDEFLIFPADRITAISIPSASIDINPGSIGSHLFTFALYNGYVHQIQTLNSILLSNISRTIATSDYADYELGQVYLYLDADSNRVYGNDSLVATGFLSEGKLQLSGLDISFTPEALSYFFVVCDIPLNVIDADSLAISVAVPSDFVFSEAVNINGDLPLSSGGYAIINGSVTGQYELIDIDPQTLSPGETSVPIFSFIPAHNGNQPDVLETISIANLQGADTSDIASMKLWMDTNGDNLFGTGDSLIGSFTYSSNQWGINALGIGISGTAPAFFAVADISPLATPGVAFQGSLPINGCGYASENDGPRDSALSSNTIFTISNSPLRVSYTPLPETYSVGQNITVSFSITNMDVSEITDVTGEIVGLTNASLVTLDSSSTGPVVLASGASQTFNYYYTASSIGTVLWQLRGFSASLPDSSAIIQTDNIIIQSPPSEVAIQLINSMPASTTKGQENVYPLSIGITHPESTQDFSSLRLDSLFITVTDGSGNPVASNEVFSQIIFTAGYNILAVIDTLPAQSVIPINFVQPVIINQDVNQVFTLLVNIDSSASVSDFKIAISEPGHIPLMDNNTNSLVTLSSGAVFPLSTASCRIDIPASQMVVSASTTHGGFANYGQDNVSVLQLKLRHPGEAGSSQIQFTGFIFNIFDSSNIAINASTVCDRIRFQEDAVVIGELFDAELNAQTLEVFFNSPITLSPGQTDSVRVMINIKDESTYSGFGITVTDSASFNARDLSSGSLLAIATDTALVTGSVFPIESDLVVLRQPALAPHVCITSNLPSAVVSGTDNLELIEFVLTYPPTENNSPVTIDNITIVAVDSIGIPLVPNNLFDRIGIAIGSGSTVYNSFIPSGIQVVFDISDQNIVLGPGDSIELSLVADIESDVPYDNFKIQLPDANKVTMTDVSDTSYHPVIIPMSGCTMSFPYITETVAIYQPAGRPALEFERNDARLAYPGQNNIQVFEAEWTYDNPTPQGDMEVLGLTGSFYRRSPTGLTAIDGGSVFSSIRLYLDNTEIAEDTSFTGDMLQLTPATAYTLSRGDLIDMRIECDLSDNAPEGNYLISFNDSTFLNIRDKNLSTSLFPILSSAAYPIYSLELSVSEAGLESSFTNYPNPFNISIGEETTIGYTLSEDAFVDLEIFTITGEAVTTIAENVSRSAGAHMSDSWNGNNGSGIPVMPGTYLCRITTRYVSGKTVSYKRKIAVLR
ncbi:MAG: right-handed parallel beta-helix repeat-containing protein [candidate division Zixibacteria bacterium]|nr:right-handed parallel beta-helix repeat-containing protein [candidate division Zixibacteria bacterium]